MEVFAREEDLRLDVDRRLTYKGSALVRFEHLRWEEYTIRNAAKRNPDREHIERIKRIFRKGGCRPRKIGNHIPAIVEQHQLDAAIDSARQKGRLKTDTLPTNNTTIDIEDGYPELEFSSGIQCLDGLHRISAAKEYLPPAEKWWIVDLYLSGISYELKTVLNEAYSNEERPCDGEIYRKILEYRSLSSDVKSPIPSNTCSSLEMLWWTHFNESQERKLRGLFGNSMLAAGFDDLSKIPGLFDSGMMVTTLHTVMATRCFEEITNYNEHISKVWANFLKGVENGHQRISKTDVKTIELRAPGVSTFDSQLLHGQITTGAIFSGFAPQEREIIWKNILAFKGIIPSLSKFFQDILLLQTCVGSIGWLVTVPRGTTVFTTLALAYKSQTGTQLIQTTENTFQIVRGTRSFCMTVGYLGLFAYAARHCKDLPTAPCKTNLKEIPRAREDREVLRRFASYAKQSGFTTPEIERLEGVIEPFQISDTRGPIPINITTGPGETIKRRSGRPHAYSFKRDKEHLFLPNLCDEKGEAGEGITSFFVLKSWFRAFFGQWMTPTLCNAIISMQLQVKPIDMGKAHMKETQLETLHKDTKQMHDFQQMKLDSKAEPAVQIKADESVKEQDTPIGLNPQFNSQELKRPVCIRFIEQNCNPGALLNPIQGNHRVVKELWVDSGDPKSLVLQQVTFFLKHGQRTCDKNQKYIPAEECYRVATEENDNTLFLIAEVKSENKSWYGGEDKFVQRIKHEDTGSQEFYRSHELMKVDKEGGNTAERTVASNPQSARNRLVSRKNRRPFLHSRLQAPYIKRERKAKEDATIAETFGRDGSQLPTLPESSHQIKQENEQISNAKMQLANNESKGESDIEMPFAEEDKGEFNIPNADNSQQEHKENSVFSSMGTPLTHTPQHLPRSFSQTDPENQGALNFTNAKLPPYIKDENIEESHIPDTEMLDTNEIKVSPSIKNKDHEETYISDIEMPSTNNIENSPDIKEEKNRIFNNSYTETLSADNAQISSNMLENEGGISNIEVLLANNPKPSPDIKGENERDISSIEMPFANNAQLSRLIKAEIEERLIFSDTEIALARDAHLPHIKVENKRVFRILDMQTPHIEVETGDLEAQKRSMPSTNLDQEAEANLLAADPPLKFKSNGILDFTCLPPHPTSSEIRPPHMEQDDREMDNLPMPSVNNIYTGQGRRPATHSSHQSPGIKQEQESDLDLRDILEHQDADRNDESDSSNPVVDSEGVNATNADIFAPTPITIYLKKLAKESYGDLSPASELKWQDLPPIHAPFGDQTGIVEKRLTLLNERRLFPHDKNLRQIEPKDGYKVARMAEDHTLYLKMLFPPTDNKMSPILYTSHDEAHITKAQTQQESNTREKTRSKRRVRSSSKEGQPSLFEASPYSHRDKIGKSGEGAEGKTALSYQEEPVKIRGPKQRIMREMVDPIEKD